MNNPNSTKGFNEFYTKITSHDRPFGYQKKVAETLLTGKNVILSVPTGAGKTWASIMPFLFARNQNFDFPKKMIYSLPLRTLCNSISQDVNEALQCTEFDGLSSIQTGEYSQDEYFEKDMVFSTIDQTLSSFLCFPLSLSSRQANINAGALIGSYLVFDEFHLLDENLSMSTTIGMLKMLSNLSRCCIMTATLSSDFMQALQKELDNFEIITLANYLEDKRSIGSLKPEKGKKSIHVLSKTISAHKIIESHKTKSIVICNRVETAQKIYIDVVEQISNLIGIEPIKVICLHSRFFDKDRKEKEFQLKELFGKEANDESVILIATQVIEAGMDISCEVMHTEISPINSFLQRVGRCARFSDQVGEIFIYDVLEFKEKEKINIEPESIEDKSEIRRLNNRYLPYSAELCKKTFNRLQEYETLDGDIPEILIEQILKENEELMVSRMRTGQNGGFNQDKITLSWNNCQKNNYRNTIRDIQSVEITLISDGMCQEICQYPYRYQSFGMYKWSLVGWLNKISKSDNYDRDDWLVKELYDNQFLGEMENDEDISYQLKKVLDFKRIPNQVYVNAKYFGYHTTFGFNYHYSDTFDFISPKKDFKSNEDGFKSLTKDTFFEHNMGLVEVFRKEFLKENRLDFTFGELANFIDAPSLKKDDFIKAVYLMIVLHDYGKLNGVWQKKMQHYQAMKDGFSIEEYDWVLAHTDYDRENENDCILAKKAQLHKRPPHAGVGAYVAQEVVPSIFDDNDYLKSSISMAIARHHSPLSMKYPKFHISDHNYIEMQRLLKKVGLELSLEQRQGFEGEVDGFEFEGHEEKLVYLFFVRILRLCDQKATENLKLYFNN